MIKVRERSSLGEEAVILVHSFMWVGVADEIPSVVMGAGGATYFISQMRKHRPWAGRHKPLPLSKWPCVFQLGSMPQRLHNLPR